MGDSKRYEIYRGSDRNGWRYVCSVKLEDGVWPIINEKLRAEKYDVYYTRRWAHDDGFTYIDYGSHKDFFRYKMVDSDETVAR